MIIYNSENYYELAWAVRETVFNQIIGDGGKDLQAVLDAFCDFEYRYVVIPEILNGRNEELGLDLPPFLSGKATITPLQDSARDHVKSTELSDIQRRIDRLAGFVGDRFDTIVELGCGYGFNLFRLHRALGGRPLRYIAAEYTKSGRRLCARLATLDGGMPLETAFIDHKNPDLGFMAGVEKALIFTCHSIEQVAALPENYFAVLASAAPRVLGIHFEPFGFQVACDTPQAREHKRIFESKDWNTNFYTRLKAAEAAGTITLRGVELEGLTAQAGNPTSIAIWDNGAL